MRKTATLLLLIWMPLFLWPQKPNSEITKVHVIFKTHLDIGFTNLGSRVVDIYLTDFIPATLNLKADYPWTTGSWILSEFLAKSAPDHCKRLEDAILQDRFHYHALPFTLQAELCDSSLFASAIELSQRLDKRFGRKTIAAKITDVPGITRSVIPIMSRNGIKLLHIGKNSSAACPDVPGLFNWQHPDGSRILVMYQHNYGEDMVLPGTTIASVVAFTGDNHGPHTSEQIAAIYAGLKERYPNAELISSSLDKLTEEILASCKDLPVVTQEIGDTWMYGVASDPEKIARMRLLMRLRNQWIAAGKLERGSDADLAFSVPLLLVSEHTWGYDVKTFLKNWDKYDFDRYPSFATSETVKQIEASWNEKQQYISDAVAVLPVSLREEAIKALALLTPEVPTTEGYKKVSVKKEINTPFFDVQFDLATGGMCSLIEKANGRNWASTDCKVGEFAYQTYSGESFDTFISQYCPPNPPDWALSDYGKPGLDKTLATHALWYYSPGNVWVKEESTGTRVLLELALKNNLGTPFGAPRKVYINYVFSALKPSIEVEVSWFDKSKNRIPEAIWFSFMPKVYDASILLDKMGYEVEATDVVRNGARAIHGVSDYVKIKEAKTLFVINTWDAPVLALNRPDLLTFDNAPADASKGVNFCLLNTCWGTNYSQWCDSNMKFRFEISIND